MSILPWARSNVSANRNAFLTQGLPGSFSWVGQFGSVSILLKYVGLGIMNKLGKILKRIELDCIWIGAWHCPKESEKTPGKHWLSEHCWLGNCSPLLGFLFANWETCFCELAWISAVELWELVWVQCLEGFQHVPCTLLENCSWICFPWALHFTAEEFWNTPNF